MNPSTPKTIYAEVVGRLELITPATEKSIETALASRDGATLKKYGRLLYPILSVIAAKQPGEAASDHMYEEVGAALAASPSSNP